VDVHLVLAEAHRDGLSDVREACEVAQAIELHEPVGTHDAAVAQREARRVEPQRAQALCLEHHARARHLAGGAGRTLFIDALVPLAQLRHEIRAIAEAVGLEVARLDEADQILH
jgi:hypothetical protein